VKCGIGDSGRRTHDANLADAFDGAGRQIGIADPDLDLSSARPSISAPICVRIV